MSTSIGLVTDTRRPNPLKFQQNSICMYGTGNLGAGLCCGAPGVLAFQALTEPLLTGIWPGGLVGDSVGSRYRPAIPYPSVDPRIRSSSSLLLL
jgi:hypothetical protein